MRRTYLDNLNIEGDSVMIGGSAAHHLKDVLREKAGDSFIGFDGSGHEYEIRITALGRDNVTGRIVSCVKKTEIESALKLTFCQSLPKGTKMDDIVRDITELGAAAIIPVLSERVVPRTAGASLDHKYERWRRIAQDAAKVAHRTLVPEIHPLTPLAEALRAPADLAILFWEGSTNPFRDIAAAASRRITSVAVFVGPEGGYTAEEVALAEKCGVVIAGLGRRILRTTTAAVVAAALVMYELEQDRG